MGEVEANRDMVTRHDFRHDRHTVSLLTDHLVFSPKYRGKVLLGDVAEVAEEIIRENCKELDIEIITNFLEGHIKNKKIEKLLYTHVIPVIIV